MAAPASVPWLKIAAGVATPRFPPPEIQRHFREADRAGRLTVPDLEICAKVAARIEVVFPLLFESPLRPPVSSVTRKHARLFMRHLRRDREAIKTLGASEASMRGWDALVEDSEAALSPFLAPATRVDKSAALATSMAHLARAAWRTSGRGREPRDVGPESPIVKFVAAALDRDPGTVSRHLRKVKP
jgi:hypothetical protein